MSRKATRTVAVALSVSLVLAVFSLPPSGRAAAATDWHNSNWRYRRPVTVDNSGNPEALSNYQVKVVLSASGFDFSKARPRGQDIRFSDSDGTTPLDYWIESYDSSSDTASIWVNVPSVPASSSKCIYMYYGNGKAQAAGSGDDTFLLFDRFDPCGPPDNFDKLCRMQVALAPGPAGSWDERIRERMTVLYDTGKGLYEAWYSGHTVAGGEQSSEIGYATSSDAVTWTRYMGNPVLSRAEQDQDPTVVKVGGTYYMYVERTDPAFVAVDLFTSGDGINWTVHAGNPVKSLAATPLVWVEGSDWYMLYEDYPALPPYDMNLAVSVDGKVWVDSPSNPVIVAENLDACPDGIVKKNGTYHLYYHGQSSPPTNRYATSTDRVNWTNKKVLYPREYESFFVIEKDGEVWAYAWDVGAYERVIQGCGDVSNTGIHMFKGYDAGCLDPGKWEMVKRGDNSAINIGTDGVELSPYEWTTSSVSLRSKATFTNDVIIEVRKRLYGSSYTDVSLGSGGVVDADNGGTTDWWHTTLKSGYIWSFNHVGHASTMIMKMPAGGGSSSLSDPFDPGTGIKTNFQTHRLTYASSGMLYWHVDGSLKAKSNGPDTEFLVNKKHLMLSQGEYDGNICYGGQADIAWVRVRKYASVEPTVAVGTEQMESNFYFAEGYTGDGFQVYLSIANTGSVEATALVTYMFSDGTTRETSYAVPPDSRYTVDVNSEVGPGREVSTRVLSEESGLVVERPIYFNYQGKWAGGHCAVGAPAPAAKWYFAEGTTLSGFDTWITVQNPGDSTANVDFHYMIEGYGESVFSETVAPHSRGTFDAAGHVGADRNISILVESDVDVVVERPMYFDYQGLASRGWTGGSDVVGANSPGREWYLAEGTTRDGFEEWLCIQNPGDESITVDAAYALGEGQGGPVNREYTVAAKERLTVSVNRELGPHKDVSVKLTSGSEFIAERPMYFEYKPGYRDWDGGHDVLGAKAADTTWFFAEGYTGNNFEEWLCIQNDGDQDANVTITYLLQSGAELVRTHTVMANSRYTLSVNLDAGPDESLSARVESDMPIVCERPMYFDFNGLPGGHDVVGYTP